MLFIDIAHINCKYSYHFWTFEFLKYNYQKWIEGVDMIQHRLYKLNNILDALFAWAETTDPSSIIHWTLLFVSVLVIHGNPENIGGTFLLTKSLIWTTVKKARWLPIVGFGNSPNPRTPLNFWGTNKTNISLSSKKVQR